MAGGPLDGALARQVEDRDEPLGVIGVFGCDRVITLSH